MTWKIVGAAEASVLYIYIDNKKNEPHKPWATTTKFLAFIYRI